MMSRAEQARRLREAKQSQPSGARPVAAPAPARAPIPTPAPIVPEPVTVAAFDPADWPVAEVLAYLDEHPNDAARVLTMETEGKGRKSILSRGQ